MAKQRTTEFVPGYPLFYPYAAMKIMYDQLGVKSQKQFGAHFGKDEGITDEDMEKILYAGLYYDPSSTDRVLKERKISIDEIRERLIPSYYDMGKGYIDLFDVIMMGLINARVVDGKVYIKNKKREEIMNEDRLMDLILKSIKTPLSTEEKDEVVYQVKKIIIGAVDEEIPTEEQGEDMGDQKTA